MKAGGYYDIGEVFVTKLNPDGDTLVYSTYLGGSGGDQAYGIAVDGNGSAYVTGHTDSTNYPTQNPYQGTNTGGSDVFITKLSSSGNTLVYSTYLGGSNSDEANGIAVDGNDNAYVTGMTDSTNFPTENPYQSAFAGSSDAFVAVVSSSESSDPSSNVCFKQVELTSIDGEPVLADEDAKIILTITNSNVNDIPESGWNMEIYFNDSYNRGLLDLPLTTYSQKSTLVQKRKTLITIPALKPGENKVPIPISLSTLDLKNDYHLSFADTLDIYGSPAPSSIDYSDLNHQAHADISIMSATQGDLAECGWGIVKLVIKGVVYSATKGLPLDDAGLKASYKFFVAVGIFAGEALVDGVFNKEDLRDLVMESLKLLWSIVKIVASITCAPCKMAIMIVDFLAELYSGLQTLNVCADVISSIAFDVTSYFNNLGVSIKLFIFKHGTEITITNSLGQVISVANGTISNEIPDSSAFYITDGEVILIPGNDSMNIQIKGTNTSTMEIACAVPLWDNQSLYNQYMIPVIPGTILTTTYTNKSGVDPIKVDIQGDGQVDQIKYPDVSEISPAMYFPDFTDTANPNSWRSLLIIQNPNGATANVTLQLRSRSGDLLYQGSHTIPAHGVAALRPRDLAGSDCAGSAVLTSNQTIIGSCQITRNSNEMCMSYIAFDRLASNLYYPDITDTTNLDSWRSLLVLQNPHPTEAKITLEIWSRSGDLVYSGNRNIPDHGAAAIRPRDLTGADLAGSVVITSDRPIAGTCQITRNSNEICTSYNAFQRASVELYYPDFMDTANPDSWQSWVVLQNPTSSPANITLNVRSRSGDLLFNGNASIRAYGVSAIRPRNLVGADCAGSVVVSSDQPITGTCQITRNSDEMCMSYNALDQGSNTLYYPDFTDTANPDSWRSLLDIQNPTASAANITLEIRSRAGDLLYSGAQIIPAHGVNAIRPRNLAGSDCSGSVVVSSDQPIMGTCQITRNDNSTSMSYSAAFG
jgi:hypothetical protein